jgi:hypothetical protein
MVKEIISDIVPRAWRDVERASGKVQFQCGL